MKRIRRTSIRRVALGLATAALVVPAAAQARPLDVSGNDVRQIHSASISQSNSGAVEIPYLSHGVGFSAADLGAGVSPDDRAFSRQTQTRVEIPYLSHGVGFSVEDLGLNVSPDDRAFSKQSSPTPVLVDDGNGFDVGTGTAGGLVLILAAAGAALAIRHSKKAKLSPA
jgi:hypothetical protein